MKRKLLLVALLALPLLLAGGALGLRLLGPKLISVAPPSGRAIGAFDHPRTETSMLAVRVAVPVALVARIANEQAQEEFEGSGSGEIHRRVKNGAYAWKARRGEISVENTGQALRFSTGFAGGARFRGEVDARIVSIPIDTSAELQGVAMADASPRLTPDWQVDPGLVPVIQLTDAKVGLGGLGNIDLGGMLGGHLGDWLREAVRKNTPAIRRQLDFRSDIEGLWRAGHVSRQVSEDPAVWLSVTPTSVLLSPIDYSRSDLVAVSIGIASETYLANRDPGEPLPGPLPDLVRLDEPLITELNLPVIVSERELNELLAGESFDFETGLGGAIEVSRLEARVGQEGYLDLKLDLFARQGGASRGVRGEVWVRGRPVIDEEAQTLGFTEVSLTMETRDGLSATAAWLLEGILVRALESQLRLDMRDYQAELAEEVHKALAESDLPAGIGVSLSELDIRLSDIYTVTRHAPGGEPDPAIVIVVQAIGEVETFVGDEVLSHFGEP
jgi:hypothetical protein